MATFTINTLTDSGSALMSTALAEGKSIEFTGMAAGDGVAPASPKSLTELVNKVMDITIAKIYEVPAEPGTTMLRASFQNKTGTAFRFREAGIYARLAGSGSAPILYAYANAGDTADLIDTVEEGSLLQQTLVCPIVTGSADVLLIDNPSVPITRQDLTEYLPLSGGTMTGDILANKTALFIRQTANNRELSLLGGVSSVSGGGFYAYGGENESGAGWFRVRAAKDGKYTELIGTPDGKLYWKGSDIITSAGGDINGTLVNRNYSHPVIQSMTSDASGNEVTGATLYMFPHNEPTYKGGFALRAVNSSGGYVELCGKNDGTLSWNDVYIFTTGEIKWYAGASVPAGFLLCNGAAVSRTTYAKLFAEIGTKWGAGNGSTTFNLPNLIDRVPWGSSTGGGYIEAGLPDHNHTLIAAREYAPQGVDPSDGIGDKVGNVTVTTEYASTSNSIYGKSNTVQPPAAKLMPIIKY